MKSSALRRPWRRLFSCVAAVLLAVAAGQAAPPSTPAMTTIADVLYRADGTPAAGTLLISWPAFTTADHASVAAGSLSVTLGAGGAVNLALAPNEGADPAGSYYKVVLKLDDGTSNVEYWAVPAASPTTISAIRATVVPAGVAMQAASRAYVDAAVAAKANDSAVVHKSGNESVAGVKQFSVSPLVPTPGADQAAANKSYVDSVAGVPSDLYVLKAGDTLTGPLILSADPTAPGHASNRHYVDTQIMVVNAALAGKADLDHTQDASTLTSGVLDAARLPAIPVNKGGTGQAAWTAGRCVRVKDDGSGLEVASADCGTGGAPDWANPGQIGSATPNTGAFTAVTSRSDNKLRAASQFSGADAGARISAAIADLPATGGTVYADFEGAQTISTDIFSAVSKPVRLILHQGTYSFSLDTTLPTNITLELEQGAVLAPAAGKTVTIKGGVVAAPFQKIVNTAAGTVSFPHADGIYVGWYGAVGDGVTDDGATIQAALTANPGRNIILPPTSAACTGGGCADHWSYYSSTPLVMTGNGQTLDGRQASIWNAIAGIKFAPNLGTGAIRVPKDCFGCVIRNLALNGQSCWVGAPTTNYPNWTSAALSGDGSDGIQLLGGEPKIEDVAVDCFGRHGIFLDGSSSIQSPSQPDGWEIENALVDGNHAYGIFPSGGDANTGTARNINSRGNLLAGIYDNSVLGNLWLLPESNSDGRDALTAGATSNLTSIQGTSGTVTVVTATGVSGAALNAWVTIGGTTNYNGTYYVTQFTDSSHFQFQKPGTFAQETAGTAQTASSTSIFAVLVSQGAVHGAYVGRSGGGGATVWLEPYCESNSYPPNFTLGMVIGGNCGTMLTGPVYPTGPFLTSGGGGLLALHGNGWLFHHKADTAAYADFMSGVTANQQVGLRFFDYSYSSQLGNLVAAGNDIKIQHKPASGSLQTTFEVDQNGNMWIDPTLATGTVYFERARGDGLYHFCKGDGNANCIGLSAVGASGLTTLALPTSGTLATIAQVQQLESVAFSATPTFSCSAGTLHKITLTGDVTSSTLSNCVAGQKMDMLICQDASGNHTFTWPSNMKGGMTVGATASKCSAQGFVFDGSNAYATSSGVTNQ